MADVMPKQGPKVVRIIEEKPKEKKSATLTHRKRVAAYCRVSTKMDEQLNSYETQYKAYTDLINSNPEWDCAGIFADKGITGTSVWKRDGFNKLIRKCKRGQVDMIITKSIARFARNTLDCIKYTRMLKAIDVDVYFEEQNLHSTQPGAEFYISIYGSVAQAESENISANVKWGKEQSAKAGKAPFFYKKFIGYKKGEDGQPMIDEEQAEIVKFIYDRFLAGDSMQLIAKRLEELKILSPGGKEKWTCSTIQSILTNERYKGDVIINKTYIVDCLSKKVKVNNGERPKYYIENNHPAIIDSATFGRVQEELARRTSKMKIKQVGTKTDLGKYSSKYALTELLICGECKSHYRRVTWTIRGKKKIVWRCISRLDYGKKYCHNSPSVEEGVLQEAIMNAIMRTANENAELLNTLKLHISMALGSENNEDNSMDLKIRIAQIDAQIGNMIKAISMETVDSFDDRKVAELSNEKQLLQQQLAQITEIKQKRENTKSRLDQIFTIIDGMKNHPLTYDDQIVRQLLEGVVVESKEQIRVVFVGGLEVVESIIPPKNCVESIDNGFQICYN